MNGNLLSGFLERVKADTATWTQTGTAKPWFRGQPSVEYQLLPSILRGGNEDKEVDITQKFRRLAPGYIDVPSNSRLDEWLFLMQHHGVPTRLLDWTESPLHALLFAAIRAMKSDATDVTDAALFCLDPIEMNKQSGFEGFPITWTQGPVLQTFKFAFGTQDEPVKGQHVPYFDKPIAVYPTTIHSRIKDQRGCFTLHGGDRRDMQRIFQGSLVTNRRLLKYSIPKDEVVPLLHDLFDAGVTYSSMFQNLDGVAKDLRFQFEIKQC